MTTAPSDKVIDFQAERARLAAQEEELRRGIAADEADPRLLEAALKGDDPPPDLLKSLQRKRQLLEALKVASHQQTERERMVEEAVQVERMAQAVAHLEELQEEARKYAKAFDQNLKGLCDAWLLLMANAASVRSTADSVGLHRDSWYGFEERRLMELGIALVMHELTYRAELIGRGTVLAVPGRDSVRPLSQVLKYAIADYLPKADPPGPPQAA